MRYGCTSYLYKDVDRYVRAVSAFGDPSKIESAATTLSKRKTSAPYKVGDYYNDGVKEGVVFEVSADGRHGKIVSMEESAWGKQWSDDETEQKRLIGANNKTNGAYNMAKVKTISGGRDKYPAFGWCSYLGKDWYLPSIAELRTIYKNKDKLNPHLTDIISGRYWSSTENDEQHSGDFQAWYVDMYIGIAYLGSKGANYHVRAVSAF